MEAEAQKLACPGCGATEISFDVAKGQFHCFYCGVDSAPDAQGVLSIITTLNNAKTLQGHYLSPGMGDLRIPDEEVVSFRCPSCQAEMSVDSRANLASLSCHWCRHLISVADIIANGPRPDGIIPFVVPKDDAEMLIRDYLYQRRHFADPTFVQTFHPEMIRPVYLPYAMGDFRWHASFHGKSAILIRTYKIHKIRCFDYDLYDYKRRFNLYINDLLVEANWKYTRLEGQEATLSSRNIINSILPFDTAKIVDYDPKLLNGDYRAEFRNMSFEDMKTNIRKQFEDITIFHLQKTLLAYTSGYKIEENRLDFVGDRLESILCPLWLYSYRDAKKQLHYICVNGQTGEVSASLPYNKTKFFFFNLLVGYLLPLLVFFTIGFNICGMSDEHSTQFVAIYCLVMSALIAPGALIFFYTFVAKKIKENHTGELRRHEHESLSQSMIDGLEKEDRFLSHFTKLTHHMPLDHEINPYTPKVYY
jgi:ribosomal protein S27E